MSKSFRNALALASALFLSLPVAAHAGTIDGFTTAFSPTTLTVGGTSGTGVATSGVTSNPNRAATLTATDPTNAVQVQATVDTTSHRMVYSTAASASSGKLQLNYGSTQSLNMNLTADGSNMFLIAIPAATSNLGTAKLPVQIQVFCTATDGVTLQSSPVKQFNLVNGTNRIAFSNFSSSCNLKKVRQIVYTFNATSLNGLSYQLKPLQTVYYSSYYY